MSDKPIIMDFETFYDKEYSLRKLSYPEYIRDKRFKVHGLGVDDENGQRFLIGPAIPKYLKTVEGRVVVFHNAFFDAAILAWRFNWRPAYMMDTLGLANHVLGPVRDGGVGKNDLDTLALRLGLPSAKGDLSFMLGVKDPTPGDLLKLEEYVFGDLSITRQVLNKLLPRVGNRDFELWLLDHTLRIYTDKPLGTDPKLIASTIKMIEKRRAERVKAAGVPVEILSSNNQFAEELKRRLKESKVELPMKLSAPSKKDGSRKMIPALAKADPAFLKLAEHKVLSIQNLVRGRLVERSAAQALARLRTLQKLGTGGIPVHLAYYGAHTGRFAAGGGFNFQNLTSPDRAIDPVDREIASSIRAAVVAGEGFVFAAVDAAQIEARVLAWLAGQQSILDAFGSGADLYSQFISVVLGEDIHKPTGQETTEKQHHLKLMRGVGKIAVLGLGYSMGVDKFMFQLRQNPDAAKMMEAGKIGIKLAAKIVSGYRETYPEIVNLWRKLNDAFGLAYRGAVREVGPLRFSPQRDGLSGKGVTITLPSGRHLYYRNVRLVKAQGSVEMTGVDGEKKTIERNGLEMRHGNGQKVYGGLLAENVTQAVARDILVEQGIWAAEQAGFPVALHVHDEVVVRVPQVQGQAAHDFLVKSLSTPPEWGQGLVLGAEGRVVNNLGK